MSRTIEVPITLDLEPRKKGTLRLTLHGGSVTDDQDKTMGSIGTTLGCGIVASIHDAEGDYVYHLSARDVFGAILALHRKERGE